MNAPTTNAEAMRHSEIPITMTPKSSKVYGYGYDAGAKTLSVQFKGFDGAPRDNAYHYPNVTPEMFAALEAAESKGKHINAVFVKTQYPFEKLLAGVPAAPANEHDPLES